MGLQGAIAKIRRIPDRLQHRRDEPAALDCDPGIPNSTTRSRLGARRSLQGTRLRPDAAVPRIRFDLHSPSACSLAGLGSEDMREDASDGVRQPAPAGLQLPDSSGDKNQPRLARPMSQDSSRDSNYWNDANNANDTVTKTINGVPVTYDTTYTELGPAGKHDYAIPEGDKRLVTLFFTPYNSFGNSGQERLRRRARPLLHHGLWARWQHRRPLQRRKLERHPRCWEPASAGPQFR